MSEFRGAGDVILVFSAVLGAVVGSFLNACIHRVPRGLGLLNPRRSFCPGCNRTIPWYENLPVLSWLLLRGRCAGCGWRIPARYVVVELLTAALFVAIWWRFGWPVAVVWWVFAGLLVAATFIDFEHMIIPDGITLGGVVAGIVFCVLVPQVIGAGVWWRGGLESVVGAIAGFGVLFLVVEGGKRVFGKKRHRFPDPEPFEWFREGNAVRVTLGGESFDWWDVFSRERDEMRVVLEGAAVVDGRESGGGELVFTHDTLTVDGVGIPLSEVGHVSGRMRSIVIPREAMGFGDVKFLACIGAFVGWQGVLFTLFAGSVAGSVAGIAGMFLQRDRSGARIPFGPFLALGALVWVFGGNALVDWYFRLVLTGASLRDF